MNLILRGCVNETSKKLANTLYTYASTVESNETIIIEHQFLTDCRIPSVLLYKETEAKLPVVFLIHGRTGDKSSMMDYAFRMAQQGMIAIAIDARQHGERKNNEFDSAFTDTIVQTAVMEIVKETTEDIIRLIDYFKEDPRIDTDRIGISGYSMGGTITFLSALADRRIKVAAPFIDSPDWNLYSDSEAVKDANTEILKAIRQYSPLSNADRYFPTALLLQNGGADPFVPVDAGRLFSSEISKYYTKAPERYSYIEHEGIGHDVTEEMVNNAVSWFLKYL